MLSRLIICGIGYLFGCILASDLVARALSGRSAFDIGDGNPGMANVGAVLGRKAALLSLAGDIGKTVLAVVCANLLFPELGRIGWAWAGLGATLGHDFPFWHRLRGGKGVTTIASTIILVSPLWGILTGLVGLVAIVVTSYLSTAALVAMAFYAIVMLVGGSPELAALCLVFMVLQVYGHWSKLRGIADGTTKRASLALKVRNRLGWH